MSFETNNGYSQHERRQHNRYQKGCALYFDETGSTTMATTENISAGGLYLHTKSNLEKGSFLTLRIPYGDDDFLVVRAEVVHTNPGHGAGLRFVDVSENDQNILNAYVQQA